MPLSNWQTERAKTRQPYMAKLVVLPETPCAVCTHTRSSHSVLVLQAACRVPGCECTIFEPRCGCGHLLASHTWGTPPTPWHCYQCKCKRFGATIAKDEAYRPEQLKLLED